MSSAAMLGRAGRSLGYALKRAQQAYRGRMDDALRPLGLTTPQYAVLKAIEEEAGISSARLARATFVTPQTMQGILTNLDRIGLLVREADPSHGRILQSHLTEEGRRVLDRAHHVAAEVEQILIASFGEDEVAHLTEMLYRCAEDLGDPERNGGQGLPED